MNFRTGYLAFADWLHRVNAMACLGLLIVIFSMQLVVVVLRYAFAVGFLELQDIVAYGFACLVVLGIPVALRLDRHVRVDIFRENQSDRARRAIDAASILLLLIPVFSITLHHALPGIVYSWRIFEGSVETGGLPGYFLVKTTLAVSCTLMIIQGLAMLLGSKIEAGREGNGE